MIVTTALLHDWEACQHQVDLFLQVFPAGEVEVTRSALEHAWHAGLDLREFGRRLSPDFDDLADQVWAECLAAARRRGYTVDACRVALMEEERRVLDLLVRLAAKYAPAIPVGGGT